MLSLLQVAVAESHEIKSWEILEKENLTHLDSKVNLIDLFFFFPLFNLKKKQNYIQIIFLYCIKATRHCYSQQNNFSF